MAKALASKSKRISLQPDAEDSDVQSLDVQALDVQALKDENARLRELVIQLSELVIKNIVDTFETNED